MSKGGGTKLPLPPQRVLSHSKNITCLRSALVWARCWWRGLPLDGCRVYPPAPLWTPPCLRAITMRATLPMFPKYHRSSHGGRPPHQESPPHTLSWSNRMWTQGGPSLTARRGSVRLSPPLQAVVSTGRGPTQTGGQSGQVRGLVCGALRSLLPALSVLPPLQ